MLTNQFVSSQPYFWRTENSNTVAWWRTDLRDSDYNFFYPQGTYTVWAESMLNNMKENYKNAGADYTGKTVSPVVTITLVTDRVTVQANRDSVIKGNLFSVTVYGRPGT